MMTINLENAEMDNDLARAIAFLRKWRGHNSYSDFWTLGHRAFGKAGLASMDYLNTSHDTCLSILMCQLAEEAERRKICSNKDYDPTDAARALSAETEKLRYINRERIKAAAKDRKGRPADVLTSKMLGAVIAYMEERIEITRDLLLFLSELDSRRVSVGPYVLNRLKENLAAYKSFLLYLQKVDALFLDREQPPDRSGGLSKAIESSEAVGAAFLAKIDRARPHLDPNAPYVSRR
jgi:hypothetical protein